MFVKLNGKLTVGLNYYIFEMWRAKIEYLEIKGLKLNILQFEGRKMHFTKKKLSWLSLKERLHASKRIVKYSKNSECLQLKK